MATFRIHYAGGQTLDVTAETPSEARDKAQQQRAGIITKVKVLKGGAQ